MVSLLEDTVRLSSPPTAYATDAFVTMQDDFYVFSKPSLFQKRISLSQITKPFSESPLDLLNPILSPSNETDSVLELSSEKSGLRLTFSTNRTSSFRSAS